MHSSTPLILFLTTSTSALTFTDPLPGSTVDLTAPLKITWVPSANDPSTFTLSIVNTLSGTSDLPQVLGTTTIRTSSTSYTLPANTISSYGDGFELQAIDSAGNSFASSGEFSLADGVYTLQTASDGALTIVTSSTQGSAPTSIAAVTSSSSARDSSSSSTAAPSKPAASTASSASSTASQQRSSSTRASSTQAIATASSASSSTSSASAAATSSSSSDSNSNLGFDSAGSVLEGSVGLSCAAVLGGLAFAMFGY